MEYLKIEKEFPRLTNSAVALGKFDGLHRGHRKLVESIVGQKKLGAQAVLFAFELSDRMILTRRERGRVLEQLGVDTLIECPLDSRMRHMRAENFVKEILVGDLQASYVAVGEDFRFGYERKGTPQLLCQLGKKYGFQVEVLSKEMDGHRKISSTFVREELKRGNMEKFAELMGMQFSVEGTVKHGRGMGRRLLLPTTNLIPPGEKLMPPNGVYITRSFFADREYEGITNVGYKPTVGENFLGVETYLFDCEEELYGHRCRVEFLHFQRPEKKYASLELLREQLLADAEAGRQYFDKIR